MTSSDELTQRLAGFVGRLGAPRVAPDPVNAAMIRHWCAALGDRNPVYRDDAAARAAGHGGVIAPPAMLQAWTMPGYAAQAPGPDAVAQLYELLDASGYHAIVATDSEQDYLRPLRLGDVLTAVKTIASISDEKTTALGPGFFITSRIDIVDADGAAVGRQLHRVLKFRPAARNSAAAVPASDPAALRPRPNVTQDTRFFFEGAKAGRLLIQRCNACAALQHPPTAACAACGSLDLGVQQASGRATLFSHTVVHAPVVAPFKPPYLVALVELEEGTRLVTELVDIAPVDAHIGMALEVDFAQVDAELVLPVFRRATGAERLPALSLPLDRSFIVATAIATRDYQPVHHDPDAARRGGSEDIFMNILTTQGLVGRYVTDWAGPAAVLQRIAIRLGAANYPGDTLRLRGEVRSRREAADASELETTELETTELEIAVHGANRRGEHVRGSVTLRLPATPERAS